MTCQGHEYSMEKKETTVINLEAHPNLASLYRAMNDPKVAAILKSFGIDKEVEYVYQEHRRIKLATYVITTSDSEETKRLVNKLIETLPEFLDDDDKQLINSAIDNKVRQERQIGEDSEVEDSEVDCSETVTEELCMRVLGVKIFCYRRTRTTSCK